MCVGGPPKPMQPIRPHSRTIVGRPGAAESTPRRLRSRPVLDELVAEPPLDAEVAARDVVIVRRRDLDDVAVLHVQRQVAADAAVRADGVDLLLLRLVPGAGLAQIELALPISAPVGQTATQLPQ